MFRIVPIWQGKWKEADEVISSHLWKRSVRKKDHPIGIGIRELWPAHNSDEMLLGTIIGSLRFWWKTTTGKFSHL
jgi:hypothetical protein